MGKASSSWSDAGSCRSNGGKNSNRNNSTFRLCQQDATPYLGRTILRMVTGSKCNFSFSQYLQHAIYALGASKPEAYDKKGYATMMHVPTSDEQHIM